MYLSLFSQAVYGRIEGMYTRSQLMSSLAEQKDHTLRLVGKVDELAGGLGDMEVCVEGCAAQYWECHIENAMDVCPSEETAAAHFWICHGRMIQ